MKKILLWMLAVSAVAHIDHNRGVRSELSNDGIAFGVYTYTEQKHRYGKSIQKEGALYEIGVGSGEEFFLYVDVAGRTTFNDNHALVAGFHIKSSFRDKDDFDEYHRMDRYLFTAYQRKLEPNQPYWVEAQIKLKLKPVFGKSHLVIEGQSYDVTDQIVLSLSLRKDAYQYE